MAFMTVPYPGWRLLLAWIVALAIAGDRIHGTRHAFDHRNPETPERLRADGNSGHAQIDFGGQWVLSRMLVTGHGQELYNRNLQWEIVRAGYPREATSPWVKEHSFPKAPGTVLFSDDDPRHDDDWLMYWFMGQDSPRWAEAGHLGALPFAARDPFTAAALVAWQRQFTRDDLIEGVNQPALGGPLYPPVQALLYAPIGAIDSPQWAYRVLQWLLLGCSFLAGYCIRSLTRGAIWWPVATAIVLLWPGSRGGLELGQNAVLTLTILLAGWVCVTRDRDTLGGIVWGLLAFKPVWALAFFMVPLLLGRWRFCLAMMGTGVVLGLATIPFVGWHSWWQWLAIGKEASELYLVNKNWIFMSRDLFGIPRRALIDFQVPLHDRKHPWAGPLGWALWFSVFLGTVVLTLRQRSRQPVGLAAGFLALGAFLCCYRFMYYDMMLSLFGYTLLVCTYLEHDTPWSGGRIVHVLTRFPCVMAGGLWLIENVFVPLNWEWHLTWWPGRSVGLGLRYPWDTLVILLVWAWAGWQLLLTRRRH